MSAGFEFTGERFVPGVDGEIVYEHVHRYAFARALVQGKRVLDAACGEGYGSALLAPAAASVTGVDIDADTIAHARERYQAVGNLAFVSGSVAALPLADASIDVVVSFETIEHLPADLQPRMLAEFARVLAPGGCIVLSAPNRVEYSDKRGYANPFHLHEHDRAELDTLLAAHFPARRFFRQRLWLGSTIWREGGERSTMTAYVGDSSNVTDAPPPEAMYYLILAAAHEAALPRQVPGVSLFCDAAETELTRAHAAAREAIRLDGILGERTAMLDRKTTHVEYLEKMIVERELIINERDSQIGQFASRMPVVEREIADLQAKLAEAQSAIAAQERIIDFRQGGRWWLMLPWLRMRSWWHRIRGE